MLTSSSDRLIRRVRILVVFTMVYNVVEAAVSLWAGTEAGSTALIGFGLDSVIEVSSAAAVAWQFSAPDGATRAARERRALRIIACSFFALAGYVTVESARALWWGEPADPSLVGVILAAVSVVVMPVVSLLQRHAGRQLGSRSVVADSSQTLLCTYLSGVLLVGLLVNATVGWSWADPLAGLIIAGIALREGFQAWKGHGCGCEGVELAFSPDRSDTCSSASGCCP